MVHTLTSSQASFSSIQVSVDGHIQIEIDSIEKANDSSSKFTKVFNLNAQFVILQWHNVTRQLEAVVFSFVAMFFFLVRTSNELI